MTERRHVNQRTGEVFDNPAIRPFADWLREQSQGKTQPVEVTVRRGRP